MGRQTSPITFVGTVGGITGYIRDGKHFVKKAEASDPGSDWAHSERKRRKSNPEFGRVSTAGRLIRHAGKLLIINMYDGGHINRLTRTIRPLIDLDTINLVKERKILKEHVHFIKGFEFNERAEISKLLSCPFEHSMDADSGVMKVFFEPFVPKESIAMPRGSVYFRIAALGCAVNFDKESYEQNHAVSRYWPVNTEEAIAINLTVSLPLNVEGVKMLMLGVQFFEEKYGKKKVMRERGGVKLIEVV